MQLYPGWSARDNYGYGSKKKKRKKDRSPAELGGIGPLRHGAGLTDASVHSLHPPPTPLSPLTSSGRLCLSTVTNRPAWTLTPSVLALPVWVCVCVTNVWRCSTVPVLEKRLEPCSKSEGRGSTPPERYATFGGAALPRPASCCVFCVLSRRVTVVYTLHPTGNYIGLLYV